MYFDYCLPLAGDTAARLKLSAWPFSILWQGILAGHLWSCSMCLVWMISVLSVFWSLLV